MNVQSHNYVFYYSVECLTVELQNHFVRFSETLNNHTYKIKWKLKKDGAKQGKG